MDFYKIMPKSFGNRAKQDYVIEPDFVYITQDLVCKGGSLYGYWYDGKWRSSLTELIRIVDKDVSDYTEEFKKGRIDATVTPKFMEYHGSSVMDKFLKYTKNLPDSDIEFNTRIIFSNETPVREDYSTTQLSYTPSPGPTPAFDQLFGLLYEPEELDKILWFIGAALTNSMKRIQKFLFLYGGKVQSLMSSSFYSRAIIQGLIWLNLQASPSSQRRVLKRHNYLSTTTQTYILYRMTPTCSSSLPTNQSWSTTSINRNMQLRLKAYLSRRLTNALKSEILIRESLEELWSRSRQN